MSITFKRSLSEAGEIREALRRRVTDVDNNELSEREVEARIVRYLSRNQRETLPPLVPGNPIFSHQWRDFIKDTKFYVGMLNGRLGSLEEKVRTTAKEAFGTLNDIQQEALVLDASITEEEIKWRRNFTNVHFNSFTRSRDMGLGTNRPQWLDDYKTGLTFASNQESTIIPGIGLVLPLRETIDVPLVDVKLLGEGTDVGDSATPILSNSPRNLLIKNKTFRHVIIRHEYDKTGRLYKKKPSRVTLLVEFGNTQLVNHLELKPLGQSTISIDELSYINESGEEVVLDTGVLPSETNILIMFEPVRTRYMKIRLRQYAPITKTQYALRDWRVEKLNELLEGVGFTQLLPEDLATEAIQGRIFDFSLEEISAGLFVYEPTGVFRSKPVSVKNPLGMKIIERSQRIDIVADPGSYNDNLILPEGEVLNEYYIGVLLQDKNKNTLIRDLIPVPDSYPIQREFLPLMGGESRLKLFPDLLWNLERRKFLSVTATDVGGGYVNDYIDLEFASNHGYEVGELIDLTMVGPVDHPINGDWTEIEVVSETILRLYPKAISTPIAEFEIDENVRPLGYVYLTEDSTQEPPITVYENNTELTIGSEYQISLDAGSTWLDDFPYGQDYLRHLRLARSGRFRIRINQPRLDRLYWVESRALKTQYLGDTNLIQLKNGRVIFNGVLRQSSGWLNTVVVSRGDTSNPYISPLIQYYALGVRENVS